MGQSTSQGAGLGLFLVLLGWLGWDRIGVWHGCVREAINCTRDELKCMGPGGRWLQSVKR